MGTYDPAAAVSFKLKAGALQAALARLSGVALDRVDGVGVEHVYMEGRPEGVFCSVGCSTHTLTVPVMESEGAGVLLPHLGRLRAYAAACAKTDDMGLASDGEFVRVQVGDGKKVSARVRGISRDAYERVSLDFQPKLTLQVNVNDLSKALECVARVMSANDPRAFMTGGWVEIVDGEFRVIGSDGHRLNLMRVRMEGVEAGAAWRGVIQGRHIRAIQGLLGDHDGEHVEMSLGDRRMRFFSPMGDLTIIPGPGVFPDYLRLVEPVSKATWKAVLPRDTLMDAIDRISSAAEKDWGLVVTAEKGVMKVRAMPSKGNINEDEAVEEIPVERIVGNFELSASLAYFRTGVGLQPPGELTVYLVGDSRTPIFMISQMEPGAVHIVMPMNFRA